VFILSVLSCQRMPVSINIVSGLDQFKERSKDLEIGRIFRGPDGRRVFPLGFFPKLVDHPLGMTRCSVLIETEPLSVKIAHDAWHGLLHRVPTRPMTHLI
jgi:hypothetical protein